MALTPVIGTTPAPERIAKQEFAFLERWNTLRELLLKEGIGTTFRRSLCHRKCATSLPEREKPE
ncbi:hypothetical protein BH11GEM2_BH11GEM2_13130 [soil metagenome]